MALTPHGEPAQIERVGQLVPVLNQYPHAMSDARYYATILDLPDGRRLPLLFTEEQIADAIRRRKNNPEDVPAEVELTWWEQILGGC